MKKARDHLEDLNVPLVASGVTEARRINYVDAAGLITYCINDVLLGNVIDSDVACLAVSLSFLLPVVCSRFTVLLDVFCLSQLLNFIVIDEFVPNFIVELDSHHVVDK